MPSHQKGEPSSSQIGLPRRFWRKNSRGDAWLAAEPSREPDDRANVDHLDEI